MNNIFTDYPGETSCPPFELCFYTDRCWDAEVNSPHSHAAPCFQLAWALISIGTITIIVAETSGRWNALEAFRVWQARRDRKIASKNRKKTTSYGDSSDDGEIPDSSTYNNNNNNSSNGGGMAEVLQSVSFLRGKIGKKKSVKNKSKESNLNVFDEEAENAGYQNSDDECSDLERSLPYSSEGDNDVKLQSDNGFITTIRTEANFIKNNTDPDLQLPNTYTAEYTPSFEQRGVYPISSFLPEMKQFVMLGSNVFSASWIGSLGLAMICSGGSTLLWNIVHYEQVCYTETTFVRDWLDDISKTFTSVRSDYDYYPIIFIVGYLSFIIAKWRQVMVNCHTIQGRMHDVALMCGACVGLRPSVEVRKKLYKIYRYLNAIHALCYKSVSPTVGPLVLETDFVNRLGLLEAHEVDELLPMDNKIRDALCGWLTAEVSSLLLMDGVNAQFVNTKLATTVGGVRGTCGEHHDLFVRDNPNLYINLMLMIVNFIVSLIVVSYPFSLVVYAPSFLPVIPCFQPVCMIGVFVLVSSFRTSYSLMVRLRNPFSWTSDRIKVDNLLASTDRCMFALMRCTFRDEEPDLSAPHIDRFRRTARPLSLGRQNADHNLRNRSTTAFSRVRDSTIYKGELLVPLREVRDL